MFDTRATGDSPKESARDAVATGIIGCLFRGFLFNVILKLKGWNPKADVSFSAPGNRFLGSMFVQFFKVRGSQLFGTGMYRYQLVPRIR